MNNATNDLQHKPMNAIFLPQIASGKLHSAGELINRLKMQNNQEAFIIGNSATLNTLTRDQLERMARGFSIGFSSFALFQGIKADVLFTECDKYVLTTDGKRMLDAIKSGYQNRMVLLKDLFCADDDACMASLDAITDSECYYTHDYFMTGNTPETAFAGYSRFFKQLSKSYASLDFLIRKRASITMALFLLLVSGFKKIHFVACELENSSYFNGIESHEIHLTEDRRYGMPVSDVIGAMIKAYNQHNDNASVYSYGGKLVKCGACERFQL
jgi:hypothetical protein